MMQISYVTIETLSPVVVTAPGSSQLLTASSESFSGTLLRGVLAGKYVSDHKLGTKAHEDENFIRYFFSDLRFVSANPTADGKRAMVLPLSLMKAKAVSGEAKPILDLLSDEGKAGYKSLKGLSVVDGGTIRPVSVKSSMTFHMSRSGDNERLSGHSQDGKVYTYESIDAGQTFEGAVIGDDACLQAFFEDVGKKGKSFNCRIGRSKRTEYGGCRLTFTPPQDIPDESFSETTCLVLDTPLLPTGGLAARGDRALLEEVIDVLNQRVGGNAFTLGRVFSTPVAIENFVGIWQMRRPRTMALAAGTVFEIHKDGPWQDEDVQALTQLMYGGAGDRTEEGFGQLRRWKLQDLTIGGKSEKKAVEEIHIESPEVKKRAAAILESRVKEQLRNFAYEDAAQLKGLEGGAKTHLFARLESWLDRDFRAELKAKAGKNETIGTHLRRLRLNGAPLYEIFNGDKPAPYESADRKRTLDQLIPDELVDLIGFKDPKEAYFHEYWLWFFRHSRKRAVQVRKTVSEVKNDET
ncbi:hypothetical protein [Megasphaera sp.]|uniref:hypothetical protein n=1 Tax=Megasphaera sp. TaxID=2023260 RepID=UPI0027B8FA3E|nr:hypothetical protein [Megasphaera sp.]